MAVEKKNTPGEVPKTSPGHAGPETPDHQPTALRRIGILGGTFDPIHYGHLFITEEARVRIPLERVLFVPAAQPPHKARTTITAPEHHRLRMVELAIASNPYFEVSRVDIDRPGPHYSVDMIPLLQEEYGPQTEFYFIMGLDSLTELPTWHEPARLLELCRLAVASREGYDANLQALERTLPGISARTLLLDTPELEISSTDIERRIKEGLPIKYLLPEAVEEYIHAHRLYLDPARR